MNLIPFIVPLMMVVCIESKCPRIKLVKINCFAILYVMKSLPAFRNRIVLLKF